MTDFDENQVLRTLGPLFLLQGNLVRAAEEGDLFDNMISPLLRLQEADAPSHAAEILNALLNLLDEGKEADAYRSIHFSGVAGTSLKVMLEAVSIAYLELRAEAEPDNMVLKGFLAFWETPSSRKEASPLQAVYKYYEIRRSGQPEIVLDFMPGSEFEKNRKGERVGKVNSAAGIMELFRLSLKGVIGHLPSQTA